MAITNRTRISLRLLLVFVFAICASNACHSQAIQWQPFEEAKDKARAEQKLLMVVQGPDDVSLSMEKCATANSFQKAALSDARLSDFYDFRVVATYRATGLPRSGHELRRIKKSQAMQMS